MSALPSRLTRSVLIRAERATVFRYFTDSARFAAWWGPGSTIDARVGGTVLIRYPNAVVASGNVESIVANERIVFRYGYADGAHDVPAGASRVTIALSDVPEGTRLDLLHEFATDAQRNLHEAGWRYQLSVFANVVARELLVAAVTAADRWFLAWNETEDAQRRRLLAELVEPDVAFRDSYAAVTGIEDLHGHIGAAHLHMGGTTIARQGEPRYCQGALLVDWVVTRRGGEPAARGTNFVALSPRGRIREVIGFWSA